MHHERTATNARGGAPIRALLPSGPGSERERGIADDQPLNDTKNARRLAGYSRRSRRRLAGCAPLSSPGVTRS